MKTVSVSQMRELDKKTIENGISGDILMERAGRGVTENILEFISYLDKEHVKRFVILAGKGNNGGDAYVVARLLAEKTKQEIQIFAVSHIQELKDAAFFHATKLPPGIPCEVRKTISLSDFRNGDIIIDGLLGTGFSKPIREPYKQWIETVNASGYPVISIDIPSGFDADTGDGKNSIIADLTITIGLPKTGFLTDGAGRFYGNLKLVDIGIPKKFIDEIPSTENEIFFIDDARPFFQRIPRNSHKKSRGILGVIGGSRKYGGAPFLSASAALRTGCGYVVCAVPALSPKPASNLPVALITREISNSSNGHFDTDSVEEVKKILADSNAVVIGPGMGTSEESADFLSQILKIRTERILLDADALNLIASYPQLLEDIPTKTVLTPHPGEMRRLLEAIPSLAAFKNADRISQSSALAKKFDIVVVLKGNGTVVADSKHVSVNSSGTPALATAGTGDVLSGIIGTFLAQNITPFDAARLGVFVHGLAAELSQRGQAGLIADDLLDLIPAAIKKISPFA